MKTRQLFGWLFAALLLVGITAGSVLAQDQVNVPQPYPNGASSAPQEQYPNTAGNISQQQYPDAGNVPPPQNVPGQNSQDPSGRVARLQFTEGEVSMQPGGVNDWVAASLNRPLTTSDRVWTDKNSRAELNVGDGFIRMNSETSLTLTNISNNTVQLELDQGVLEVTVKHLEKGVIYEIDTPNYAFTVMKTGVYRFDVLPYGDQSWVTVRSGAGEATGKGPAVKVSSGQQVRFTSEKSLQHTAQSAPVPDGFEDWAAVRDKRLGDSLSAKYVSPGVIGYQDLDAYGTWQTVAPYGPIWVPTSVPAGWAPYRYGHWVWIAPWGWTWVDDAPWGFAPFHYGRWVYDNNAWGWSPGPLGYWNPYYAPALVGWIGGPGFGVGFGWGWGGGWGFGINFGWFPLGWGAPYYPHYCGWGYGGWYHGGYYNGYNHGGGYVSSAYLHNVNVSNTHINNINNVTNNYYHGNLNGIEGNRNIPGAVTAAPKSAFTSGAAINKVGTAVPKGNLRQGQLMHGADVNPTRQSVLGGNAAARAVPPSSATSRSVVTHATPPAGPARFNEAQSGATRGTGAPSTASNSNAAHTSGAGSNANAGNAARNNATHPPSTGAATANNQVARANVPRPPSSNDTFARGNSGAVNNRAATNGSAEHSVGTSTPQSSTVHRPPANYTYHPYGGSPQQSAPSHQSSPSQHAAPQGQGNSHGSGSSHSSSSSGSRAYGSASRPPASYTYHPAPRYSGSSSYAAGRSGTSVYGGGSRGSYPSGSYSGAGRSYGQSPTYMSRNYGASSTPHYSAPSSPHYSGGGSHSSGGSSHGGGGGGHR